MDQQNQKEEVAVVLDFLPNGYPFDKRPSHVKTPIIQALGKLRFVLLELVPRKGVQVQPNQEVYIGEEKRQEVHHIAGRLDPGKLTTTARSELEFIVKDIVSKSESRFIEFFNKSQPLTTRMHQLELLPGLGKKHMWQIIEERKGDPFKGFADLKKRIQLMPDPQKILVKRILSEINGAEKYNLFVER